MDDIKWGGSGIERVVFDYIQSVIPFGSTVVELGSGFVSTDAFSRCYVTYSVDHQKEYIGLFPNINYIYAPIISDWYESEIVKRGLPPIEDQKLIFIDGCCRKGILDYMHLFNPDAIYLVHDTNREKEIELVRLLENALGRKATFHTNGDYWATI